MVVDLFSPMYIEFSETKSLISEIYGKVNGPEVLKLA